MTVSDWQWKRRRQLDDLSKIRLVAMIREVDRQAGGVILFTAHPMVKWSRHDLVAYLAEMEETYKVGAWRRDQA